MAPYRTPAAPQPLALPRACPDFAFRCARLRLGADRFEMSFFDLVPLFTIAFVGLPCFLLLPAVLAYARYWLPLVLAAALYAASSRNVFVVTRDTSWLACRLLGVELKRTPTGRHSKLALGGWNWTEICIEPSDPALAAALAGEDRAVLVEWDDSDERRTRDAALLMELAREQIARLHKDVQR